MLIPLLALFLGAALLTWLLLRSTQPARAALSDAAGGGTLLTLGADAVWPIVARLIPRSALASFESAVQGDDRAGRMGARRVIAIVTLLGVALALLFAWFALSVGAVRLALWSLAVPPLTIAIAHLYFRQSQLARQKSIRREFPYALDLLVLLCRAGAPPAIALARVAFDRRRSVWGRELQRVVRETELGATRASALTDLAERARMPEVSSFVATVRQAEELGRPLGEVLEQFADRLREQRVQNAEAAAGAASVKIMAPAVIVFMVSVLLLLGPFLLKILRDGLPF